MKWGIINDIRIPVRKNREEFVEFFDFFTDAIGIDFRNWWLYLNYFTSVAMKVRGVRSRMDTAAGNMRDCGKGHAIFFADYTICDVKIFFLRKNALIQCLCEKLRGSYRIRPERAAGNIVIKNPNMVHKTSFEAVLSLWPGKIVFK